MKRFATRRGAGLVAIILLHLVGPAGAGTIDFESPALGSTDRLGMTYQTQGVTIWSYSPGLIRESAFYPCSDITGANQSFESLAPGPWCLNCPNEIHIEFPPPPADPVSHVALEVRGPEPRLLLLLYSADNVVIGSAETQTWTPGCTLGYRGYLEATASGPVAYALVASLQVPPPEDCIAEAWCAYSTVVVIDNLSFDAGAVPVRPTTWGQLKISYR